MVIIFVVVKCTSFLANYSRTSARQMHVKHLMSILSKVPNSNTNPYFTQKQQKMGTYT